MEFADGYFRKVVAEIFIDEVRQVETTELILYCKYGKQRARNRDIFHRTALCKMVVSAKWLRPTVNHHSGQWYYNIGNI